MLYNLVVADFANRTRQNLRAIEELRAQGHTVFEVTQLVNSMLGLLVFPREEFVQSIPKIGVAELQERGWPVPKARSGFPEATNLKELVRYLRNAISHFSIEFIGDGQGQISVLRVWNNSHAGERTWEADLGLEELRGIAERFVDLLLDQPKLGLLPNEIVEAVEPARGYDAAGSNSYRSSVVKMLDGLAA